MLRRSFKPAKCKTSLKLASSRIKLLKNKKQEVLKQLKREVAQLLDSGQNQTARIRVEHVVREEKMISAFVLIGTYCEFIVGRLTMIESQKNCPIDLKEAITSIIFASPRCADIPELLDVRKHFTAKYGKEFITGAVEMRPDCGVNRMLVDKLSAIAPDGQTKLKILTAIAKEHNITWDPSLSDVKDPNPPDDLLNGPNTSMKADSIRMEPPYVEAASIRDQICDPPVRSFEQKPSFSLGTQIFASTDIYGSKPKMSTDCYSPQASPSGTSAFALGRQDWDVEFKDATSAAEAAAECAERASIAARAAAELSTIEKMTRQYSTESQKSGIYGMRDEGRGTYASSKIPGEHIDRHDDNDNRRFYQESHGSTSRPNRSASSRSSRASINDENMANSPRAESHGSTKRPSPSASLRSSRSSIDDDTMANSPRKAHLKTNLSRDNSLKGKDDVVIANSMKKQSGEPEVENMKGQQNGLISQNYDYHVGGRIKRQSSSTSSDSHSRTSSGDRNVLNSSGQNFRTESGVDPSLSRVGLTQASISRDTTQTSSDDDDSVLYDQCDSNGDSYEFGIGPKYDEDVSKFYFPSPERESPVCLSPRDSKAQVQKQNVFSADPEPKQSESFVSTGSSFTEKRNSSSNRNTYLQSSSDGLDGMEVRPKNNIRMDLNVGHRKRPSFGQLPSDDQSPGLGKSHLESDFVVNKPSFYHPVEEENDQHYPPASRVSSFYEVSDTVNTLRRLGTLENNDLLSQVSSGSATELKFEALTSGFQNKGSRRTIYNRNPSSDTLPSSKQVCEDTSSTTKEPNAFSPVKSFTSYQVSTNMSKKSSSRAPIQQTDSDSDSQEEVLLQNVRGKRESHNRVAGEAVSSKASVASSKYDNNDFKEDVTRHTSNRTARPGSRFSPRTKASPSTFETVSYSAVTYVSKPGNSNSIAETRQSNTSYGPGTPRKPESKIAGSGNWGSSEQSSSTKLADSKPALEANFSLREDNFKSLQNEQPNSPLRKPVTPSSMESPKASTLKGQVPSREDSVKKPSHVHPKLPDYDTIAVHLQSLRLNRQED